MKIAKVICLFVIALMLWSFYKAAVVGPGMAQGGGSAAAAVLYKDAWLTFILRDLLTGLLLMTAWIIFREKGGNPFVTALWVVPVIWWGNIVVAVYVYRALDRSQGDWARVFLGARSGITDPAPTPVPLWGKALLITAGVALAVYAIGAMVDARVFVHEQRVGYGAGYLPLAVALVAYAFRDRLHRNRRIDRPMREDFGSK